MYINLGSYFSYFFAFSSFFPWLYITHHLYWKKRRNNSYYIRELFDYLVENNRKDLWTKIKKERQHFSQYLRLSRLIKLDNKINSTNYSKYSIWYSRTITTDKTIWIKHYRLIMSKPSTLLEPLSGTIMINSNTLQLLEFGSYPSPTTHNYSSPEIIATYKAILILHITIFLIQH